MDKSRMEKARLLAVIVLSVATNLWAAEEAAPGALKIQPAIGAPIAPSAMMQGVSGQNKEVMPGVMKWSFADAENSMLQETSNIESSNDVPGEWVSVGRTYRDDQDAGMTWQKDAAEKNRDVLVSNGEGYLISLKFADEHNPFTNENHAVWQINRENECAPYHTTGKLCMDKTSEGDAYFITKDAKTSLVFAAIEKHVYMSPPGEIFLHRSEWNSKHNMAFTCRKWGEQKLLCAEYNDGVPSYWAFAK